MSPEIQPRSVPPRPPPVEGPIRPADTGPQVNVPLIVALGEFLDGPPAQLLAD